MFTVEIHAELTALKMLAAALSKGGDLINQPWCRTSVPIVDDATDDE